MGLPSGVQWASCNIGADEPSDLGLYFSWGNIDGHSINEGYDFSKEVYNSTPAAAINTNLSLDQDAARANQGAPWRMPTSEEFKELFDNCTRVWTTVNGVNGLLLTSNVNGHTLFFPATGYFSGSTLSGRGERGNYWSSTYVSDSAASCLYFNSSVSNPQNTAVRHNGCTVRPVMQLL